MYKNAAVIFLFVINILISQTERPHKKYILYEVNRGEGFNLRRDVFMRVAVLVRKLNLASSDTSFTLVLPPWGPLYHWQSLEYAHQMKLPWSLFFDTTSINKFVPVIEFSEYLEKNSKLDIIYNLQGYAGGWTGKYEEKFKIADCLDEPVYKKNEEGEFEGFFWGYRHVRARQFHCLSVQGSSRVLHQMLSESKETSIMLERAENLLHDMYGDVNYWGVRRSMKFASPLIEASNKFRLAEFNSSDELDDTVVKEDWREHRAGRRHRGGNYACVHLRRKDYVKSREGQIPSIKGGADQCVGVLKKQGLDNLYVATDAPDSEFQEFRSYLPEYKVVKFKPTQQQLENFKDGGVAIIDQLICSHARYFIGSYESTFTFRIQEEREIMGFPIKSTFNMLCPDGKEDCEKGSIWKVEWGTPDQDWSIPDNNNNNNRKQEL